MTATVASGAETGEGRQVAVDGDVFREVFRRWASGVAVLASCDGERPHGMVVNSFCSLSADPPLVMVSAGATTRMRPIVDASGFFSVSVLAAGQDAIFERFAGIDRRHDDDRFAGLDTATAVTGAPVLPDALAWVDCRVVERHPGAGYTIFVGEIVAASLGAAAEADPLVYFRRARGTFQADGRQ